MKIFKKTLTVTAALATTLALALQASAAEPALYISFDDGLESAVSNGAIAGESGGNITFAEGKIGNAAVFDGASSIHLGDNIINSNNYSVALWVNPSALTSHTSTFFGAADSNHWVSLVPFSWGEVYGVWSGDTPWSDNFDASSLETGVWTHIAFAVDGTNITLYRNGNAVFTSSEFTADRFIGNARFFLGGNYWDAAFQGMMDEVYLFNETLSASDIAEIMNSSPAEETVDTEEAGEETATDDVPVAGDTQAETTADKAGAKTGIEDAVIPVALFAAAAGSILIIRKKK